MNNFKYNLSISQDLIDHLEDVFPDKVPINPHVTLQEINTLQGKRAVIEYLKSVKKEIEEETLNVHVNTQN